MGATAVLSEFVSKTRIGDISAEAVAATKRHILDCAGVALAATVEPAGRIIVDMTREQGGAPQARVLGANVKTSVAAAAWANGALAHLLDYDDTGFSHPTACILPAALAMAERNKASGAELVAAVCLGLEVFERLSSSGRQNEPDLRHRGFHPTSLYGCPAAAAAAGSIAKLNPRQMAVALGLAAANAGGLTQHFGTPGKGIHAGNAARAGVTAVLLAEKDYVADAEVIEGSFGFFSAFHGDNYNLAKVEGGLGPLGKLWSIVNPGLTIKMYPCCGGNLRALDATRELMSEHGIRIADVQKLEVDVHPALLDIVRFHKPTVGFQGKFSLDYVLAAMLLDHRVDLDTFSDAYCRRPELRAALEKIQINTHPEWGDNEETHRRSPVTITMKDGRRFDKLVQKVKGNPGNPITRDELVGKYRLCAGRVLKGAALEKSAAMLEGLDKAPAAAECVDLLVA